MSKKGVALDLVSKNINSYVLDNLSIIQKISNDQHLQN